MKDANKTDPKRGDIAKFKKISIILAVLLVTLILSLVLYNVFENSIPNSVHGSLHVALVVIGIYFGIRFEKEKKRLNIQTYKEVIALCKGKDLEEIEKDRE